MRQRPQTQAFPELLLSAKNNQILSSIGIIWNVFKQWKRAGVEPTHRSEVIVLAVPEAGFTENIKPFSPFWHHFFWLSTGSGFTRPWTTAASSPATLQCPPIFGDARGTTSLHGNHIFTSLLCGRCRPDGIWPRCAGTQQWLHTHTCAYTHTWISSTEV